MEQLTATMTQMMDFLYVQTERRKVLIYFSSFKRALESTLSIVGANQETWNSATACTILKLSIGTPIKS
jgi:hypothetical protein